MTKHLRAGKKKAPEISPALNLVPKSPVQPSIADIAWDIDRRIDSTRYAVILVISSGQPAFSE
jgi:hypothetical protein